MRSMRCTSLPQPVEAFFGFGREFVKLVQFVAGLLVTDRTMIQAFISAAFPDCARLAVADELATVGNAAVTIDLFGFQIESIGLAVIVSGLRSGTVIIISCGDKGRAVGTYQAAVGDHFMHFHISFNFRYRHLII